MWRRARGARRKYREFLESKRGLASALRGEDDQRGRRSGSVRMTTSIVPDNESSRATAMVFYSWYHGEQAS